MRWRVWLTAVCRLFPGIISAQQTHKLHQQTPRQQPKNQKPTRKIARQQQRAAKPTLKPAKLMLNPVKQTRRNLRRTHLIIATRRK
ncbi:hypothetical protein BMR44_25825 [Escherichia coli]|nr:hypothetical protein BMR44_25825 [Escherichia coli]